MLNKNVVTFIGCDAEYEEADIVLFGAPFDSTTSYRPGTRFASQTIRNESFGLETYSPYQDRDLTDYAVFDSGDLELPFGSSEAALEQIEERTARDFGGWKAAVYDRRRTSGDPGSGRVRFWRNIRTFRSSILMPIPT